MRPSIHAMAYTYMLLCSDGSFYVGSTRDLEHRLYEHQIGEGAAYTRHRLPVQLVWHEEPENVGAAFHREKQGPELESREATRPDPTGLRRPASIGQEGLSRRRDRSDESG